MRDDPRTLVSTEWLAQRLREPGLVVLDASWHMPNAGRDPEAEFRVAHIPGARRFDIDAISDHGSPLPHMAPPASDFAAWMAREGIGPGTQVVVYDSLGVFSAPRAWWTFRRMGHDRVAVLDGGLPKWLAEKGPVETGEAGVASPAEPALAPDASWVRTADQVAEALRDGAATVLDARPAARFRGEAPEPRPGLASGHMPGARSLPFGAVLNPDGTMKDDEALAEAMEAAGVDPERPVVTSCGSGVTAAILSLALERLGRSHALYDGSWAEWGAGGRPVETS
ncbi:Thiosulfate sulfurtransferase, rhodanese [Rubellimicrobium mesophilum DSM 19309]|uniref:3-mercaptopyruvate sulfurtransferase n=1 Tax=Rubellimicrobium mesophilum DSM 19309 TaxID=442562 RepID=A0A017HVE7_9RHOB|nr:3-mercaptopyruvate sulfurtransferase [Rubellimicrobium mesophilum]EYD78361.1 Thiosulfate sulfurtransferase, rhodanese [Rubellimicrobium mesophilum DSM 19309]